MDISIKEFKATISRKLLAEPLTITYNGKPIARVTPIGKFETINVMASQVDALVVGLDEVKVLIQEKNFGANTTESVEAVVRKCEQPMCNQKTLNPPRTITWDFEPKKMVLCDEHYALAVKGVE